MATDEKTIKAKVINTSRGIRGVRPTDGVQHLEPGSEYVGRFTEAELQSAKDTDGMQVVEFADGADSALADKTVAELKDIAAAEEVDLSAATLKADIIAAIEAKRAAG